MALECGKCVTIGEKLFCDGKALAYILGLSKQRVSQMEDEQLIFREETASGNLYNLAESIQAYIENQNKADEEVMATARKKEKAEAAYKDAKARLVQLEVAEVKGQLHRSSDVQAITEDYLYEIRGLLMSLPGQLATEVANSDNAAECASIIRTVVNRVLLDMTKYGYDPTKYEDRVRERRNWEMRQEEDDEE